VIRKEAALYFQLRAQLRKHEAQAEQVMAEHAVAWSKTLWFAEVSTARMHRSMEKTRRTHPSPVNGKGLCLACLVASTVETRRRGGKSWQLSGRRSLSTTGSGYHYQCSRSYNGGSSQQVGGPGRKRPTGKAPTFAFLAVGGASKG